MGNPNPREEEGLVNIDFGYAASTGKPWSDIPDIAYITHIANFVFATGTSKPWSDVANIADVANVPNTGAVNPIAGAYTLFLKHVLSTLEGRPHCRHIDNLIYIMRTFNRTWASSSPADRQPQR